MRALHDRVEIADRIAQLAHAQDDQDWEAVAAAFVADAVYLYPGGTLEGVDEIIERTRNALKVLDASQHLVGSITVSMDGDTASSRAYFQGQHLRAGTPGGDLYAIAGTYSDRWVRTAEGWRIEMRTQTYEWRSGNRDVVAR